VEESGQLSAKPRSNHADAGGHAIDVGYNAAAPLPLFLPFFRRFSPATRRPPWFAA